MKANAVMAGFLATTPFFIASQDLCPGSSLAGDPMIVAVYTTKFVRAATTIRKASVL